MFKGKINIFHKNPAEIYACGVIHCVKEHKKYRFCCLFLSQYCAAVYNYAMPCKAHKNLLYCMGGGGEAILYTALYKYV
jgi:hypothetical protein